MMFWRIVLLPASVALLVFISGMASLHVVVSTSMEPSVPRFSYILVDRTRLPLPGEVGAYLDDLGRVVVHRYVGEEVSGRHVFKGDANPAPDPPVDRGRVLGAVVAVFPHMGFLAVVLLSPLAFAALSLLLLGTGSKGDVGLLVIGMAGSVVAGVEGFPGILLPQQVAPAANLLTFYTAYRLYSDIVVQPDSGKVERFAAEATFLILTAIYVAYLVRWLTSVLIH
jgi:signal peptidase I